MASVPSECLAAVVGKGNLIVCLGFGKVVLCPVVECFGIEEVGQRAGAHAVLLCAHAQVLGGLFATGLCNLCLPVGLLQGRPSPLDVNLQHLAGIVAVSLCLLELIFCLRMA